MKEKKSTAISNFFRSLLSFAPVSSAGARGKDVNDLALRTAFNLSGQGIIVCSPKGQIEEVNPGFTDITGYTLDEVIGKNPRVLSSGKHSTSFYKALWSDLSSRGYWSGEIWNRKKNGDIYVQDIRIDAVYDGERVLNYVAVFSDVTAIKDDEKVLSMVVNYDSLTNLPNRALFTDRFNLALSRGIRERSLLSVVSIDLDNFKPVNNIHGHEIGDQILIEASNRISQCIREDDTACRTGGDEFLLLLGNIYTPEEVSSITDRIHRRLSEPFYIEGRTIHLTASSGYTVYPFDNEDLDLLVRHADQAMHKAKLLGKDNSCQYDPDEDKDEIARHSRLEEIATAFINNEFELYYQPKLNMRTGFVFGVEALIRWRHPKKGLLSPVEFLPFIENTDLEIAIGNWVISDALSQLAQWREEGLTLEVSVNISSYHLQSQGFVTEIDKALAKEPSVDARFLQLEILESSMLSDLSVVTGIITECQDQLGLKVALDDFGTGYSSLTHLRHLPANTVKIDRSFVHDILDDPNDYAIIEGTISLSKAFHREVIAEGVETLEQGLMLLLLGCENAQGYGIAKPMPASDFVRWLKNYKPNDAWINYAREGTNHKNIMVSLIGLINRHWQSFFTGDRKGDWPITVYNRSHAAFWFRQARQYNLFDEEWLSHFEELHRDLYLVGQMVANADKQPKSKTDSYFDKIATISAEIEKQLSYT